LIQKWIGISDIYANLIYRGTKHGFTKSGFLKKCLGKGPLLFILENSNGTKFGAYTSIKWPANLKGSAAVSEDKYSFLFSVTKKEKYPSKPDSTQHLWSLKDHIFLFGNIDLRVSEHCNSNCKS
jgi:hypothetical protein